MDCGPQPTKKEAVRFAQVYANRAALGPRTLISQVKVVEKARWHSPITARYPEGPDGPTIEGWRITFLIKPTPIMNPYGHDTEVEILVDREQVVHWRTLTEWDARDREVSQPHAPRPNS
jgi:hypothetical protein